MSTQNAGLQVDPTKEAPSMQQIDPGATGHKVDVYTDQVTRYGEAYVNKAIDRGWSPEDGDVKDYVRKHASAPAGTDPNMVREMIALKQKIDRMEQVSREDLEEQYDVLIAKAKTPKEVRQLIRQRDDQIAKEFGSESAPKQGAKSPELTPELMTFLGKWRPKMVGTEGAAMRGYGDAKYAELKAEFPNATEAQLLAALDKEMDAKYGTSGSGSTTREAPLVADGSPAGGSGSSTTNDFGGTITPATMSADHKSAFRQLQGLGAFSVSTSGKEERSPGGGIKAYASEADALKAYLQGVNQSAAEEERIWGGR